MDTNRPSADRESLLRRITETQLERPVHLASCGPTGGSRRNSANRTLSKVDSSGPESRSLCISGVRRNSFQRPLSRDSFVECRSSLSRSSSRSSFIRQINKGVYCNTEIRFSNRHEYIK